MPGNEASEIRFLLRRNDKQPRQLDIFFTLTFFWLIPVTNRPSKRHILNTAGDLL